MYTKFSGMQNENPTVNDLKLEALAELQNYDFELLRNSIQLMMSCAMMHEYLNHPPTRVEIYSNFKAMYNFLSQVEMFDDPEVEYVNLLLD